MTPGALHVAGSEYLLCAASIEQARLCYRFIRTELEPTGEYSFIDSTTRIRITHRRSNTRLRVLSSSGKRAMGIVGCPLLVADEPGSWEVAGGRLMFDAIITALGKPNSPMRTVFIGTLAPAMSGWWHDLIADGSVDTTYVQSLQGNAETWDTWAEIRRCNPLTAISGDFRKRLLVERDAARIDSRLKARFLSFRLNRPSGDESEVLLTTGDWERVTAREVPERQRVQKISVDMRRARALPYGWIEDSSRRAYWNTGYAGVGSFAEAAASIYRRDYWDSTDTLVEVWCESRSLAGVLGQVCREYVVPLFPAGGSIPAWAGEPCFNGWTGSGGVVYPRVGGGTVNDATHVVSCGGLSPRGRGNPIAARIWKAVNWSIPAWAGEPHLLSVSYFLLKVYPRVGGGTFC